jgi:sterol desaturase/sphingolipid hydroxylase (fatty acid hydroxylase superfamily)
MGTALMSTTTFAGKAAGVSLGVGTWTFVEYAAHRWAMHGRPRRNPIAVEHRRHHVDPDATDPRARALGYAAMALVSSGLGRILGGGAIGRGFAAGILGGYASYELLHWRSHHSGARNRFEARLRERHMVHHRHAGVNLGITTGIWDRLRGTAPQARAGRPPSSAVLAGPVC